MMSHAMSRGYRNGAAGAHAALSWTYNELLGSGLRVQGWPLAVSDHLKA